MGWIVLITGLYLICMSLVAYVRGGFISKFLLKFIPFILGASCLIVSLDMLNILSFNIK